MSSPRPKLTFSQPTRLVRNAPLTRRSFHRSQGSRKKRGNSQNAIDKRQLTALRNVA
jgi:hypothetical protein